MLLSELNERCVRIGDYIEFHVKKGEGTASLIESDCLIIRPSLSTAFVLSNFPELNGASPESSERAEYEDNEFIDIDEYRYSYAVLATEVRTVEDIYVALRRQNLEAAELIFSYAGLVSAYKLGESIAKEDNSLMSDRYYDLRTWRGMHSYHASHGESFENPSRKPNSKPYRIGVELEVVAKSRSDFEYLTNLKSNWMTMERDSSLPTGLGIELVTIPLNPSDAKSPAMWEGAISMLSRHANAWKRSECGLHVHIGREIFGNDPEKASATLGKLLYLYHLHLNGTDLNTRIFGRASAYHERDGKTQEGMAVKVLGSEVLKSKSVVKRLDKSLKDKSSEERYFDINIRNSNTIEFRKGKGSINVDRIVSIVTYCEMMVEYAKVRNWTQITYEDFTEWMRKKVAKTSPLKRYFADSECEF